MVSFVLLLYTRGHGVDWFLWASCLTYDEIAFFETYVASIKSTRRKSEHTAKKCLFIQLIISNKK